MKKDYACSRCAGAGRLAQYANVMGGVCFQCAGSGVQRSAPVERPAWGVFGQHRTTGQWLRLYNVRARTVTGAIERAREIYSRASTAWKDTYTLSEARALRWRDMASLDALTWDEATGPMQEAA